MRLDCRGTISLLTAITMPILISVAAIVVDRGFAMSQRASLQMVADSAALSGALAYSSSQDASTVMPTVLDVVAANGWPTSVVQSSSSGFLTQSPENSSSSAVQVSLLASPSLWFASVVWNNASLKISAYSMVNVGGYNVCILSLTTLTVNAAIDAPNCDVAADSTGSQSVLVNGSGSITAHTLITDGSITNGGTITAAEKLGTSIADPYQSVQSQAAAGFSACQNYSNQTTLTAGCWSGVTISSALTLQSGTFFFTGLNINPGGSITGTNGVTMVVQGSFSPNGNLTITAPTSGTWDGIAIYAMGGMNVNSGVQFKINGAIYSPTSAFIPNNGVWNASACTIIVAQSITINGGSSFTIPRTTCSGASATTSSNTLALVR